VKSRICVASLRCSSVKYVEYSPSSRLGPLATAQFHSVRQTVRCSRYELLQRIAFRSPGGMRVDVGVASVLRPGTTHDPFIFANSCENLGDSFLDTTGST
jgi:hypothetical protein